MVLEVGCTQEKLYVCTRLAGRSGYLLAALIWYETPSIIRAVTLVSHEVRLLTTEYRCCLNAARIPIEPGIRVIHFDVVGFTCARQELPVEVAASIVEVIDGLIWGTARRVPLRAKFDRAVVL